MSDDVKPDTVEDEAVTENRDHIDALLSRSNDLLDDCIERASQRMSGLAGTLKELKEVLGELHRESGVVPVLSTEDNSSD